MNYLKKICYICSVLAFFFAASISVFAFSSGPQDGLTEAPGEGNCTQCHFGNSLNASGGTLVLGVPGTYLPGEMYDIVVDLSRSGQSRWGFEMTALNGNGTRAGTFAKVDGNTQVSNANSKQYIKQTSAGSARGTRDSNSWTFKWTAPTNDVGPITFYAAGNAANGDFGTLGDYIYTERATSETPVYGIMLAGVGSLTTKTTDASAAVTYTLKVTNTGNTNDTINLSTSGDASATLSPTTVSLAAGAARNVTLTVSGNALTTAGDYEVKVKATSQGDSTKTAEVTTTTTVPPVYGVTLAGVGDLTTETSDASEGVSYKFTVTNTGNTDDVIDLTSSNDAATLSQASVSLAGGASAEVTITISGDDLAIAGQYEVNVTATSQVDKTKTAVISTKTTILPVYGVTLQSEGELKGATMDMLAGVSYTLTVTNTGNTEDTVVLGSSAEFGIEGSVLGSFSQSADQEPTTSQLEIMLAAGASAEVIFTAAGDFFTKPGEYEIKVTATSQGDTEKTAVISTKTTILPIYGVTLAGVGELTTETTDASEGVSYKFTVTNTGNTDDVIDLTSSDDAATLSQTSVSLAGGASAEVTITISGDDLATAGDYEIKVTATSQGDNMKTAEVTTNTTILPVYGVTLAGVGDLTTETSDASEGVTYTLTIANTGNTDDVIDLTSSDDAATLSQTSVPLAGGASAEVTITISGDDLATAGSYEVKVTATSQGDNTMSSEVTTNTTILPVYGVTLTGVGDLTTETTDASEGVSYMLTIANTGNTDDVIDLTSSDDAATLSQTSVPLAGGASAEVTITISGDDLATAGGYEVKVTATSQGDNTMSSEVTTNTTILPVYGVTLAGVGDLTTETSDASEGVTYTLTIANTGNTDDVIDLTSSDDAATLSQTSVPLAGGASAEVTITISGDDLAIAGQYEVNVTATSQVDKTKTAVISTKTTILPIYGVMLQSEGELKGATMDMLAGVSYTLTVTNTGNTGDTVVLGSSAEFGIEGSVLGSFSQSDDQEPTTSQLEIMLAAGASAEVIFTAAGDFFTKLGEYEIKVTATSQGDNMKTAELTTNTTIEPVPWDLNADGTVNILDLVAVANQFGESGEGLSGDVNMDGEVNILDLVQVASYFGKTQAEIVQAQQ